MHVDLLDVVCVRDGDRSVRGNAIGGRRAQLVLAALALADRPMPADELAAVVWGDQLPPTWDVALRGLIRSIRRACTDVGGGDQGLVSTVPSGYRLGQQVTVDVSEAARSVRDAGRLLARGRYRAAAELADRSPG